jgi:hypothetical protein
MARDHFIALCSGFVMCTGGFGFGWFITPEPAEMKLGRLWAGAAQSIPVRTLPPEVKALRCVMVWIGTAGPEIWCPAAPPLPEEQAPPAVPTS